jgi:DNA repair exonuclease SbcCD ATPase subunit
MDPKPMTEERLKQIHEEIERNELWPHQADELLAEVDRLRETNSRLNRRCQTYESGLAEKLEAKGSALGRMLANAAAEMQTARAEAAEAEVDRLRIENENMTAAYHRAMDVIHKEIRPLVRQPGSSEGNVVDDVKRLRSLVDRARPLLEFLAESSGSVLPPRAREILADWPARQGAP